MNDLPRLLEAIIFIAARPVTVAELAAACDCDAAAVAAAVEALARAYTPGGRGFELREVSGGYTFAVAEDCEEAVRRFTGTRPPDELSPALLETLAVVAYLQPATRAEVAKVRGVSCEWALAGLEERGLIAESGRAETPGSPILYATTERFTRLFGLRSLADLPGFDEFALTAADVDELRARLLANAERRQL